MGDIIIKWVLDELINTFWSTWPVSAHIYTLFKLGWRMYPWTRSHPNSFVEDAAHYTLCFSKVEVAVLVSSYQSIHHINGLVQDCSNSSALAMELLQSFTKPSICDKAVNFTVDVVLWTELCPHCISQTSSQILFIFIDLIDQLQKNFILIYGGFFLVSKFELFLNSLIHDLAHHVLASSGCQVI